MVTSYMAHIRRTKREWLHCCSLRCLHQPASTILIWILYHSAPDPGISLNEATIQVTHTLYYPAQNQASMNNRILRGKLGKPDAVLPLSPLCLRGGRKSGGERDQIDADTFEKVTMLERPDKEVPQTVTSSGKEALEDLKGFRRREEQPPNLADLLVSSDDTESDSIALSELAKETPSLDFGSHQTDTETKLGTDVIMGQTAEDTSTVSSLNSTP